MFDTFTDHIVQPQQITTGNTFSIRGIGHHDARLGSLRALLERLGPQFDIFHQAGTTDILLGNLDRRRIDIGTITFEIKLTFLTLVVIDTVEQFLVEIDPFLESKLLTMHARRNIQGDHRRFDQQRTGTAHRIDEIRLAFPACFQDHTGSQHFIQRSFRLIHTVTAFMQALARTVDRERTVVM